MATLDIIDAKGKKEGSLELADSLLTEKLNKAVLYAAVRANLAGRHHGTVDTKTRAEVDRTGKKIFKQKGTGNARHGSRKSSPFVGGGRVFGPHPRDFSINLPRKVRQLGLREALRSKLIDKEVVILNEIPLTEIKTRKAAEFFKSLNLAGGMVVLDQPNEAISKSIRNLKGFKVARPDQLQAVDLLKFQKLIFTKTSFEQVKNRYLV